MQLFNRLAQNNGIKWELINGIYVKANQHIIGAADIAVSGGGNTRKTYLSFGSYGLLIQYMITGGDVQDCKVTNKPLPQVDFVVADNFS